MLGKLFPSGTLFAPVSWFSPFTAAVPDAVKNDVIRVQNARLDHALPRLCLCIIAATLAMSLAVFGDLPIWQQITPPAILIGTCLIILARHHFLARPRNGHAAARRLRNAVPLALGLGLIAGIWATNAFTETEKYYCMTAPVFIGIGGLITATCLLNVPRAAIAALVTSVGPIAIRLLTYPNVGVQAMGVMMVLLTLLETQVVLAHFRETVATLTLQHELDVLARTDALTKLDNRRAFIEHLDAAKAAQSPVLVVLVDLDDFKQINDTHGHSAGDQLLVEIARRLKAAVPEALCVARLGGDEFAVLLPATEWATATPGPLQRLREVKHSPVVIKGVSIKIGLSTGHADSRDAGLDVEGLLHSADTRLYADKANRKPSPLLLKAG